MEEEILRSQLSVVIDSNIPSPLEQVEVEWIRMEQDGAADPLQVRERLIREDFGLVAAEVNVPDGFTDSQGYVGWVPQESFPELDDTLFGNPDRNREPIAEGEISDPLFTQEGVYIVHKLSGPEERKLRGFEDLIGLGSSEIEALTPEDRESLTRELRIRSKLAQQRVDQWFDDQVSRGSDEGWLKIRFNSDLYAWVADQVHLSAPRENPLYVNPTFTPFPTRTPVTMPTPTHRDLAARSMLDVCLAEVSDLDYTETEALYCGDTRQWKLMMLIWDGPFDVDDFMTYGRGWTPTNSERGKASDNIIRPRDAVIRAVIERYFRASNSCVRESGLKPAPPWTEGSFCKNIPALIYDNSFEPVSKCQQEFREYETLDPFSLLDSLTILFQNYYEPGTLCRDFY